MLDEHRSEKRLREGINLPETVRRSLDKVDTLPAAYRAIVHEFGWEPVSVMLNYGMTPDQIRAVIHACWCAPRSAHQRQGFDMPRETKSSPVLQHLDTLLHRAGAEISAYQLLTFLKRHGMVVVPSNPNTPMVAASMNTVANHDVRVTKEEKHTRRLRAAIEAGTRRLWPFLFEPQP